MSEIYPLFPRMNPRHLRAMSSCCFSHRAARKREGREGAQPERRTARRVEFTTMITSVPVVCGLGREGRREAYFGGGGGKLRVGAASKSPTNGETHGRRILQLPGVAM